MPPITTNAVLERLYEQRETQETFVDQLLARVDSEARDLVEEEQRNIGAARQRIEELDAQIGPLREFETLRAAHQDAAAPVIRPRRTDQADAQGQVQYGSAGAFLVDYLASRGWIRDRRTGQAMAADPEAERRVAFALANQTTADTPGLLPHPIVGQVVSLIDATRPFISSIGGGRSMGGIPGKTFGRPKITQHTKVDVQAAEKTELPTQKMVIGEIPFTKATYGGAVDVSRQDIDWTSPAAWDILVRDLADIYAQATENAAADAMVASADDVNTATAVAANTLQGIADALYDAAAKVYASAKRLPDRLWVSVDVWANLGPTVDLQLASEKTAGTSSLESFAGNMFSIPRIVVPSFAAGTAILGSSAAFEVYEEVIGLLTAVEPSLLGVEVAYGGYMAANAVFPEGLAVLTGAAGPLREGASKSSSKSAD